MGVDPVPAPDEVRAAEVVGSLCLATDFGMGFPLEHGLHSTLVAMRLADRLGVDAQTEFQTYFGCLLFYAGCTADAEIAAEMFPEGALLEHFTPVVFGSPREIVAGIARALTDGDRAAPVRALQLLRRMPPAARGHRRHIDAMCQVAQMLSGRMSMPPSVTGLFASFAERWDGRGVPLGLRGDALPLALRIIQVARDATFQGLLRDDAGAAEVIRNRAHGAFDPVIAHAVADDFPAMVGSPPRSAWDEVLAHEPRPHLVLRGAEVDEALAAMADFADLVSPFLVGHSSGVAALAARAAELIGYPPERVASVRRAGLVHDVGRVAVPARVWLEEGPLSPGDWEHVRLHPYHSERIMSRSPFLGHLATIAGLHHERLDGSGYHRGVDGPALSSDARILAAADSFHILVEPRPHRPAMTPREAAAVLAGEAEAGRLDPACVDAVVRAAGLPTPAATGRPAGLTEREAQVVGLLARGLQTKQVASALGISPKTADRHIQNSYAKMGVSTRAAAAVFAMQHGLVAWGELPMVGPGSRP